MRWLGPSVNRLFIFTTLFALMPVLSAAWNAGAPNPAVKIELNEVALTESDELGARAELKVSDPDFDNIAAQIEVDVGDSVEARLYIYDARASLVEVIDVSELPNGPFWSDIGVGDQLTIKLAAYGAEKATLQVHAIAGVLGGGVPDGVPDGVPQFEVVSEESEGYWVPLAPAVARLVVGQNELPLLAREPDSFRDWCTGFLVSPDLMMTVAHCLRGRPVLCEQTVALFGYVRRSTAALARSCLEVVYFNRLLDIAILRLQPSDTEQPTIQIPDTGPADTKLSVIQHPRGSVMLVSQINCNIVEPQTYSLPYDSTVDESLLSEIGFTHSCDTINGSSGSPVLAPDVLAGVHQGSTKPRNHAIRALSIARCLQINTEEQTVDVIRTGDLICRNEM